MTKINIDRKVTLEMLLPHNYRIVRYGNSDSLELEYLKKVNKRDGGTEEKWEFAGYYGTIPSAIRGYLRYCPVKTLEGRITLRDYLEFLDDIKERINDIVPEELEDY